MDQETPTEAQQDSLTTTETTKITINLIPPHNKKSRYVMPEDYRSILEVAPHMVAILYTPTSRYRGGLALAHAQVEANDPLCFFVLKDGAIVVNPTITRHTAIKMAQHTEGCLSFTEPEDMPVLVPRWAKMEVEYWYLRPDGNLSEKYEDKLSGLQAAIFQHEMDHFEGINVYGKIANTIHCA